MPRGVEALIKPELLKWAREEANYSVAEAAQKADVREEALTKWEVGTSRPSIPQLRKLANVYRRPLAVFYLPEPPPRAEPVRDYRRLPGDVGLTASSTLRFEIRKVLRRREIALELLEELGEKPPVLEATAEVTENPEEVGERARQLLEAASSRQARWKTDYEALNDWRSALEGLGVLVFQAADVALAEMLGFSLSKNPLPIVAVNIKNHPRARVFTLLHEFIHLMLREGGVCDLDEDTARPPENRTVEVFCNHAAGAALVPMELLRKHVRGRTPDEDLVTTIARHFHVGREVVARRMLISGMISRMTYLEMRERFQSDFLPTNGSTGGPPPHRKVISQSGPYFTRVVLDSYDEDRITVNDVTDYLGVRPRYIPMLREALRSGSAGEEGY